MKDECFLRFFLCICFVRNEGRRTGPAYKLTIYSARFDYFSGEEVSIYTFLKGEYSGKLSALLGN